MLPSPGSIRRPLVRALWPLFEYIHDLLSLPLVGFVQHCGDDLLYPHSHLPPFAFLLFRCPAPPGGRAIVPMPAGYVLQGVPNAVDALLAQHLQETGYAPLLYLFEGLQVRGVSFIVSLLSTRSPLSSLRARPRRLVRLSPCPAAGWGVWPHSPPLRS